MNAARSPRKRKCVSYPTGGNDFTAERETGETADRLNSRRVRFKPYGARHAVASGNRSARLPLSKRAERTNTRRMFTRAARSPTALVSTRDCFLFCNSYDTLNVSVFVIIISPPRRQER